ncbi:hypothetical protein LPJ77_004309 [Coemansia sp. RSA 2523]|nr:hypothetical protein LPJ54_004027 [Coemansia sp. RSA 1824]KAJ1805288.1 hypothetical protein LPJ77_004309 [Coemansia sp. RSA 2523]
MNLQGTGTFYASGAQSLGCIGGFCSSASQSSIVQHLGATSAAGVPIFIDVARQAIVSPAALPVTRASGINGSGLPGRSCSTVLNQFAPLTAPSPMPPLLQTRAHTVTRANPDLSTVVSHAPRTIISSGSALSLSLGNVAIAMARSDVDSASVQTTLDHLSHVANNISSASYDALMQAKEAAAEAVVTNNQADTSKPQLVEPLLNAPIHESLLRIERRSELSGKAIHNYFCYLHQQCPIIHKPTFLQQIDDGSVNRFVWLSVRALASRTLLHTNTLSAKEVLIEEEYFANKAQSALSDELKKPSVDVVQGLALLSLYIFGTPRWQEASMYWCKATRLAQLMDFHVIDAPSGAIATKMHFGIFEPPKVGNTHKTDLALIPGDFSGQHTPLAQALTPLEAELRRRLWWILFTNERFCAIAERLPTMVNEARMFVHFPCSARDWDSPEFTYSAPDRVPRYQREGYMRVDLGSNMCNWTLGQELRRRKGDNLYMISEIEYGFSMSHLVAFLADMGALFRPRSPYGNDYTPVFMEMAWPTKMKMLRANVERVERIFEMVRQDILHMLAETPKNSSHVGPASSSTQSSDPVLDPNALAPGIEIPQLHHLAMLILYSTLNIHLYRMVFQIHYEFSSSLPKPADRRPEDSEVLAAFDLYVKELWARTTTTAQQVSRILRGEFPGVPSWVLTLAGIKPSAGHTADARSPSNMACSESESREGSIVSTHMSSESEPQEPANGSGSVKSDSNREQSTHRLRNVFRKRIQEQETRLHEMAQSVMASFRRTLPYALLLVAKVHLDNIESGAGHINDSDIARSYLDLADAVQFLETHQTLFTSADYVSLVKGMMHTKP